jgi:hypothetical protein
MSVLCASLIVLGDTGICIKLCVDGLSSDIWSRIGGNRSR